MSNVLNKAVLSLNKAWMPIGVLNVGEAITAMTGGIIGHPAFAIDVDPRRRPDGSIAIGNALSWEDWIKLPIRDCDFAIDTSSSPVRAPFIIVQQNYDKMPNKTPRLTKRSVFERDGGICQYSGRKLEFSEANLDHVTPASRGGPRSWENIALSFIPINTSKGNRTNKEAGLELLRAPKAPPSVPMAFSIREAKHRHWTPFLMT